MLAARLVGNWGARIDVADNGRIAITKMAQNDYDLVLLDIQLPEMDGYETADYIRHKMAESVRTIPILAMTASASTKTLENILGHGINDFITKPFEPEALSLVRGLLTRLQNGNTRLILLLYFENHRCARSACRFDSAGFTAGSAGFTLDPSESKSLHRNSGYTHSMLPGCTGL